MPPLPRPPPPRPATASTGLPFAKDNEPKRAAAVDVPRYFIEVNVPGYSVAKTVARARRRQLQLQLQQTQAQRREPGPAD